jgi:hypothetical protein
MRLSARGSSRLLVPPCREEFASAYDEVTKVLKRQEEIQKELEDCGEDMDKMSELLDELNVLSNKVGGRGTVGAGCRLERAVEGKAADWRCEWVRDGRGKGRVFIEAGGNERSQSCADRWIACLFADGLSGMCAFCTMHTFLRHL